MATETEIAKYQFQSWARKGLSAHINEQDTLGDQSAFLPPIERATVPIGVSINNRPQPEKKFALVGPGDIIGINRDMVVRTEPRNWITNVEPNYLAFIEFYDEDFPWRYTPAKPEGDHLRPWIFLLVLKEDEFERDDRRLPLPVVKIKKSGALPPPDETWLFAHVHTEQNISSEDLSDLAKYLKSLQAAVTTDPDKIYSRLLSPRHLDRNSPYHAFLVPTFEVGRRAGLGQSTAGIAAQKTAWEEGATDVEFPIYFEWYFSTGEKQDFESLVEQLTPRKLDSRIGIRSMDCSDPGFVKVDGQGRQRPALPGQEGLPAAQPNVQGLEGALKTEDTESLPLTFTPNDFQTELQLLVNLPEEIKTDITAVPGSDADFLNDPVVTVPFYGQNHARQHKTDKVLLDVSKTGWYHDLNRDPRTRVPAGFGTSVVQKEQERFMQKAWQQVERVYEGNRKIRNFQFTMQVSALYNSQFFVKLVPEKLLAVTTMLHAKILGSPTTIRQQLLESRLRAPVFSASFRRLARPSGKLAQRLGVDEPFDYAGLVNAINDGRINPAPPRGVPVGIPSVDDLAHQIQPRNFPAWLRWLMKNRLWVLLVILVLLLLVGIVTGSVAVWAIVGMIALVAVAGFFWLQQQSRLTEVAEELVDPQKAENAIRQTPPQPTFNIVREGETAAPPATPGIAPFADSVEAFNFRSAAIDVQQRIVIRTPEKPALPEFNMKVAHQKVGRAIDPHVAFPLRLSAFLNIPGRGFTRPEEIVDAMAHPDFEDATYTFLRDINKELLIPNLQLIPPDTISILETNPKFIESYMVGLNHEMGRELLWREYPTDLRGSYFRQFWEVKGISNPDTPTDAEQLKDIRKIHEWLAASELGSHKPGSGANADVVPPAKQAVLVIRGELLKRYPNTVIYAQKAFADNHGHNIIHEQLDPAQFDRELKFPLFRAEIDPDLRFFGFDLTIDQAKGTAESRQFPGDHRGWFFVIQEVPGEPRFGMDIAYEATQPAADDSASDNRDTWNNLAWNLFGETEPTFIKRFPAPAFPQPGPDVSDHVWAKNSAEMAYCLFQTPVMIAIHASEMLNMTEPI